MTFSFFFVHASMRSSTCISIFMVIYQIFTSLTYTSTVSFGTMIRCHTILDGRRLFHIRIVRATFYLSRIFQMKFGAAVAWKMDTFPSIRALVSWYVYYYIYHISAANTHDGRNSDSESDFNSVPTFDLSLSWLIILLEHYIT